MRGDDMGELARLLEYYWKDESPFLRWCVVLCIPIASVMYIVTLIVIWITWIIHPIYQVTVYTGNFVMRLLHTVGPALYTWSCVFKSYYERRKATYEVYPKYPLRSEKL